MSFSWTAKIAADIMCFTVLQCVMFCNNGRITWVGVPNSLKQKKRKNHFGSYLSVLKKGKNLLSDDEILFFKTWPFWIGIVLTRKLVLYPNSSLPLAE